MLVTHCFLFQLFKQIIDFNLGVATPLLVEMMGCVINLNSIKVSFSFYLLISVFI